MSAPRLSDWEQRLHDLVAANFDRPHEFGRHDCLLWPAAAVKALTGRDHGRGHRGKYNSLATAYRHLQQMGFDGPEALLDSLFDEVPIGFAQRGDLALCDFPDGAVPGLVMGDFALIVATDGLNDGLGRVPRSAWLKAWKIG